MGTTTELPAASPPPPVTGPGTAGSGAAGSGAAGTGAAGPQRTTLQPPDEITRSLFVRGRRVARAHPLALDTLAAAVLLAVCTVWLVQSPFASLRAGLVQAALIAVLAARRVWPGPVFLAACAIAFSQWLLGFPLLGDAALLVALYTVAAHQSRIRTALAAAVLEAGALMAAVKWEPAGTLPRSLLFLTATVVAALFAGLTAASGSRYLAWMDERARRLEIERDQQATIATAAERTRIARELHDIVSHSLSVVITLADAAAVVSRADPGKSAEAMTEVSDVGRQALSDMRAMLGVLRTDEPSGQGPLPPQPDVAQLGTLVERIQATGLDVSLTVEGTPFPLGAAAELTAYRIVQEALTNTIRHAAARHAWVTISYREPQVRITVADDGSAAIAAAPPSAAPPSAAPSFAALPADQGHGIDGMRERAALHRGALRAGPAPGGGWLVEAILRAASP
jgi:signal transduction histidine kinase